MADPPESFIVAARSIMKTRSMTRAADSAEGGAQLPDVSSNTETLADPEDLLSPYPPPLTIRDRPLPRGRRTSHPSRPRSSRFIEELGSTLLIRRNHSRLPPNTDPPEIWAEPGFIGRIVDPRTWTAIFINSKGNEYFCDIDEEYLTDRFNLTSLNTEVQYYQYALDLITDMFEIDVDDDMREQIEKSARHLYGLVHARYIVTTRGLQKMYEKYKTSDFGKCPRVHCHSQPLLPIGQNDTPSLTPVKLHCPKCEDLYNPKSSRHSTIDGAYFGTSFPQIFLQVYPALVPQKSRRRFEPRVFGFRVHACAVLGRWQEERRGEMVRRLREAGGGVSEAAGPVGAAAGRRARAIDSAGRVNDMPLLGVRMELEGKGDEAAGFEAVETGFEEEEREEEMERLEAEGSDGEEEAGGEGIDDMFEVPAAPAGMLGVGGR